jgi:hypothetical protein
MPIRQRILESPGCKTAIFVLSTMLAGVFSELFISEITAQAAIVWQDFYKAKSFYVLVFLTVLIYFYNREAILYERNVLPFKDADIVWHM